MPPPLPLVSQIMLLYDSSIATSSVFTVVIGSLVTTSQITCTFYARTLLIAFIYLNIASKKTDHDSFFSGPHVNVTI